MSDMKQVFIGFDPRETDAFAVARETCRKFVLRHMAVRGIVLDDMRERGLYWRPTSRKDGRLYDDISEHTMSTEFAISRFLTPHLAREGLAMFMDCDMLVRDSLMPTFEHCKAHPEFAVFCVKHDHKPSTRVKMDDQEQSIYARKNWSSVMVFNCDHPSNKKLTVDLINTVPGRDLHRFCWLEDDEIGELPADMNYLVGHTRVGLPPKIVHFTDGIPTMKGYEDAEFADEWRNELSRWAAA
jgi:hypothetical protein